MKYCSECSSTVTLLIPDGDNRPRFVCSDCNTIHYHNPKVITGCIVEHENQILLCKRAIEPRLGLWTIPAGFMETHETSAEGAARETFEESLAKVDKLELFCLYDIPHISQVYMIYRSRLLNQDFAATSESSEVQLVSEQNIPWDEIAFPVVTEALQHYFKQKNDGAFELVIDTIDKRTP